MATAANLDDFAFAYATETGNTLVDKISGALIGGLLDPAYNTLKYIWQATPYMGTHYRFVPAGPGPQAPADFSLWGLAGAYAALQKCPPGDASCTIQGIGNVQVPLRLLPLNAPPMQPVKSDANSSVFVIVPRPNTPVPVDSQVQFHRTSYSYSVMTGPLFTKIMVPSSSVPGLRSLTLDYAGKKVTISPGQTYTFESPVSLFTLEVLNTAKVPFVTDISFADSALAIFAQVRK